MSEEDLIEIYNERAAIREFEGGLSRAQAEAKAYGDWRSIVGVEIKTPQPIIDIVVAARETVAKESKA